MKNSHHSLQKCICILLTVAMLLTAAPLDGFAAIEWPTTKADAEQTTPSDKEEPVQQSPATDEPSAQTSELPGINSGFLSEQIEKSRESVRQTIDSVFSSDEEETHVAVAKQPQTMLSAPTTEGIIAEEPTVSGGEAIGNNYEWSFDDATKTLTISGQGALPDFNIDIDDETSDPSLLLNIPWFSYLTEAERIVVEEGITHIGAWNFALFTKVTEVELPQTLVSIGSYAFAYCCSLKELILPDSVETIGFFAFGYMFDLEKLSLPASLNAESFSDENNLPFDGLFFSLKELTIPATYTQQHMTLISELITYMQLYSSGMEHIYNYSESAVVAPLEEEVVGGWDDATFGSAYCYFMKTYYKYLVATDITHELNALGIEIYTASEQELLADVITVLNESLNLQIDIDVFDSFEEFTDSPMLELLFDMHITESSCGLPAVIHCTDTSAQHAVCEEKQYRHSIMGETELCFCYPLSGSIHEDLSWSIDPETKTLTFDGTGVLSADISIFNAYDEIIDHIVFAEDSSFNYIHLSNLFNTLDVEDFTIPATCEYVDQMSFAYCRIKEFIVEDGNPYFSTEDGVLYFNVPMPDDATITIIWIYPNDKEDTEFTIPQGVTIDYDCWMAFIKTYHLEKLTINSDCDSVPLHLGLYNPCLRELIIPGMETQLQIDQIEPQEFFGCSNHEIWCYADSEAYETAVAFDFGDKVTVMETKEVAYIEVTANKTEYHQFETITADDFVITVYFEDGTSAVRQAGYRISEFDNKTLGEQEITVTYAGYATTFTVNVLPMECEELTLNETAEHEFTNPDEIKYYKFIPEQSWNYVLYVENNSYNTLQLTAYDKDLNELYSMQSSDIEQRMYTHGLEAGETYYISLCLPSNSSGTVTVTVTCNHADAEADGTCDICGNSSLVASGTCGDTMSWAIYATTLVIDGEGEMYNYSYNSSPWTNYRSVIRSVILHDGITSIGSYAFYYCTALTEIAIPDSVTSIGYEAFSSCSNLATVTFGENSRLESIGSYAFYNCTALTAITIPDSVTSIGDYAFNSCSNLATVTFGENSQLTSIGRYAFNYCPALTEIAIPDSVTSIDNAAFCYCSALTAIKVGENNTAYASENGVLYNKDKTQLICYPAGKTETAFEIPDSVTSIGSYAFASCYALTEITIPDSVTEIGYNAFYNCNNLTTVTFGENSQLTSIGDNAFAYCYALAEITIPDSVTSIGYDAFFECSNLATVTFGENSQLTSIGDNAFAFCYALTDFTIPDSVTSIGRYAFFNCTALTAITVGENNTAYASENGVLYNKDKTELICYPAGKTDSAFVIPDGVTSIGEYAFNECSNLATVTFGENSRLESIGNYAFAYCTSLTTITIPDSVTSIGEGAFHACDSLTAITIPAGVTSIGRSAFYGCSGLQNITILNPDCSIYNSSSTIPENATIIGFANSTAQEYAENYGRTFELFACLHPNAQQHEAVAATCIADGYTAGSYCENCRTWLEGHELIPATGHSFGNEWSVVTPATCLQDGLEGAICTTCGTVAVGDVVCDPSTYPETPHNYIVSDGTYEYTFTYPGASELVLQFSEQTETESGFDYIYLYATDGTQLGSYTGTQLQSAEITIPGDSFTIRLTQDGSVVRYGFSFDSITAIGTSADEYTRVIPALNPEVGCVDADEDAVCDYCSQPYAVVSTGSCGDTLTWTLYADGVLHISGTGSMNNYNSYSSVPWYSYRNSIRYVHISSGVTSIGSQAFYGCDKLATVTFGENSQLTSIGEYAFYNCESLTAITIPDSVTGIGYEVFYSCDNLTTVTFGENSQLTSIVSDAFSLCHALTDFTIPDSVTSIGNYAFYNCESLTAITIPDSVTSIDEGAFYECSNLATVTFGENSQLTSIGYEAFYYCSNLTTVTFGENSQLTSIGSQAFYGCDKLATVTFGENSQLTSIGEYAFAYCYALAEITIPDSVTSIGNYAFYDCDSLTAITIPDSVTEIGDTAFYSCGNLTTVTFGENSQLTSIGSDAFSLCHALTEITIPDSVTSIGYKAFAYCYSLTAITVGENNTVYTSEDGVLYNKGKTELICYPAGKTDSAFVIPDSVTSIRYEAFYNCTALETVTFGENSQLTSIGNYAFYDCDSLTAITIPDSVTEIGYEAFYDCNNLTTVTFGENSSLTYLASSTFANCTALTSITIPASVAYMQNSVFEDCIALESVTFAENSQLNYIGYFAFDNCSALESISIPDGVTRIDDAAFRNCMSLTNVTFGENSSLEYIEDYAFENCNALTGIVIPGSVYSINSDAFNDCTSLASVTFSANGLLEYICGGAFRNCSALTDIVIPESVTYVDYQAFYGCTSLDSITFLNPECGIYSSPETIAEDATIIGFADSTAQTYAQDHDRTFELFVCSHPDAEQHEAVAETCTTDGYTAGSYCPLCRTWFEGHERIPATGHSFGDEWGITVPATCLKNGLEGAICATCGTAAGGDVVCDPSTYPESPHNYYNNQTYEYAFSYPGAQQLILRFSDETYTEGGWDYIYLFDANGTQIGNAYSGTELQSAEITIPGDTFTIRLTTDGSNTEFGFSFDSITAIGTSAGEYTRVIPALNPEVGCVDADEDAVCDTCEQPYNVLASGICGENLTWKLYGDGLLHISGTGAMADYSGSNTPWNSYRTSIKQVRISSSVTNIGNYAFYNCNNLTSIIIPDSVTTIANYTFADCYNLASVTFGENSRLTNIGNYAFRNCDSLTSISIPDSVTTIGNYAFYNCNNLTSIIIPDSVTSIGNYAFYECYNLASVTFGENSQLTTIAESAFRNCTALTNITIPDGVTSIGNYAFYSCSNLATVTFGENSQLATIGNYAFYCCTKLASITIPDGVTSIGNYAFYYCDNLTSVTIPDGVTSIGTSAFSDCDNLTSVTFGENSQLTSIGNSAFNECYELASITIPDSVTSIGNYAFYDCNKLTTVTFGENSQLTSIGYYAFGYCDSLTAITIPDSVTSIGDYAFSGCTNLATVTFGENSQLTSIGDAAFSNTALTNFNIPAGVTSVYQNAFRGCTSLTEITVDENNETYSSLDGVLYNKDQTTLVIYPFGRTDASFTVPDTVTTIGYLAFNEHPSIETLVFGEGSKLTSIENYAFANSNLESIAIPDSVTVIHYAAFENCSNLAMVTFGENSQLETIRGNAFYNCDALTNITIPGSVTEMEDQVFANCDTLASVTFGANSLLSNIPSYTFQYCTALETVTFGENSQLTSVGNHAFSSCTSLADVTLPDNLTYIGNNAFSYCNALASITLPDSLTHIDDYAFYNCIALTDVFVPESVTNIDNNAFRNCTSLASITILNHDCVIYNNAYTIHSTATIFGHPNSTAQTYAQTHGRTFEIYECEHRDVVQQDAIPVTCTTDGYTAGSYCENCRTWYEGHELIPATGHSFGEEWRVVSTATCTRDGYESKVCTVCDLVAVGEFVCDPSTYPETPHDYIVSDGTYEYTFTYPGANELVLVFSELTATESGYDKIYLFDANSTPIGPYTGTELQSAVITIPGDTFTIRLTQDGSVVRYGFSFDSITAIGAYSEHTRVLPATGHNYASVVTEPTCEEGGFTTYTCSNCNDTYTDSPVDPLGHNYVATHFDADANHDGYTLFECENCDSSYTVPDPAVAVSDLYAISETYRISLSWSRAVEASVTGYQVFRKGPDADEFELVYTINSRNTTSYIDTNVTTGLPYEYKVRAMKGDVEGIFCDPVCATPSSDTQAPRMLRLEAAEVRNNTIWGTARFVMNAEDNVGVVRFELFCRLQNTEDEWALIGSADGAPATIDFDTTTLEDAVYDFRAIAYDAAGNVDTNGMTKTYKTDNTAPAKITGLETIEIYAAKATLSWNNTPERDVHHFILKQVSVVNGETVYTTVNDYINTTTGYYLTNLTPDTEYTYVVAGVDLFGNVGEYSDPYTFRTAADTTAPVITALSPAPGRYSTSINFTATAADDYQITSMLLQASTDAATWTDLETKTFTSDIAATRRVSFSVSLANVTEGSYYLRVVAQDAAGNTSDATETAPFVEYYVDKTAPAAPTGVSATGGDGYIEIKWADNTETDRNRYSVYRSTQEDGDYIALATNLTSLNFFDRTTEREVVYFYKVLVNDTCGNVSELSAAVSANAMADTVAPEVISISPADQSVIGTGLHTVSVKFNDNNLLSSVSIEYKTADAEEFSTLTSSQNVNMSTKTSTAVIPVNGLADGETVIVRAYCTDVSGYTSEIAQATYTVDKTAPSLSDLAVSLDGNTATLTWTDLQEADLAGFYVYRSTNGGAYNKIGSRGKNATHGYQFIENPGAGTYTYRVDAVDTVGNTASFFSDEITIESIVPVVNLCVSIETVSYFEQGVQEYFRPVIVSYNTPVVSWLWDFGDGTTSDEEVPAKAYSEVGDYTVTLTATDEDGNTATATQTITVKEREMLGTVKMLVCDANGRPLANMPVYFDVGEDTQYVILTDREGYATSTMTAGMHDIGSFKYEQDGDMNYLPTIISVNVLAGTTVEAKLSLVKEDLIEGTFEVHEMTLDEIIAAGINPKDPANQNVYTVTARLIYGETERVINYIRNDSGILTYSIGSFGGGGGGGGTGGGGSGGGGGRSYVQWVPNEQNIELLIVVDIEIKLSYLKQFYMANLSIVNNAQPGYKIVDCTADLTIDPASGLSIYSHTPIAKEINGQQSASASWILRGDEAGDYDVSANFKGTLDRFNEPVTATFGPEKVNVRSVEDTISLVVETPEYLFIEPATNADSIVVTMPKDAGDDAVMGDQYQYRNAGYYNIGMRNICDSPIYYPSVEAAFDIYAASGGESLVEPNFENAIADLVATYIDKDGVRTLVDPDEVLVLNPGEMLIAYYKLHNFSIKRNAGKEDKDVNELEYVYCQLLDYFTFNASNDKVKVDFVITNDLFYDYYYADKDADVTITYSTIKYGMDKTREYNYSDGYFNADSHNVNYELAELSLGLAAAGYSDAAYQDGFYANLDSDNMSRATNIMKAYKQLGFEDDVYHNYNVTLSDYSDKIAFSAAKKYITNADGTTDTLVLAVVRGGNYGSEWTSNFHVGDGKTDHIGFASAALMAERFLTDYVENLQANGELQGELNLWMTSYSRGAATTNLLAHSLNSKGKVGTIDIDPEDLFVYLFATPMGAIDADTTTVDDSNIFSFVSPLDFVPKVALDSWGYGRYGNTMFLSMFDNVSDIFTRFEGVRDLYSVSVEQLVVIEALLALVTLIMPTAKNYQDTLQDTMMFMFSYINSGLDPSGVSIFAETISYFFSHFKFTLASLYSVTVTIALIVAIIAIIYNCLPALIEYLKANLANILGDMISDAIVDEIIDIVMDLLGVETYTFSFSGITNAHYPTYYMALLDSMGEDALQDAAIYAIYKIVKAKCPVDVYVYDAQDNLVASIVNNEVQPGSQLPAFVQGDAKYVVLDSDEYRVEVVGNGEGTMDYSVSEYDENVGIVRTVRFDDIPIQEGATFEQDIPEGVANEESNYSLYSDGAEIETDYDSLLTKGDPHTITISNGIASVTEATPGEIVTIVASRETENADYAFVKWIADDVDVIFEDANLGITSFVMPDHEVTIHAAYEDELISDIAVQARKTELTIGQTSALTVTTTPEEPVHAKITYTSSDDTVLSVDKNGAMTALSAGEVIVTATEVYTGKEASVTITVLAETDCEHIPVTHTEAATCTVNGYTMTTCTVCGDELSFEIIPAFGHTAGAAVMEDKAEASCETDGSYNMVVYCATCNEKLSTTAYTIPATGHDWDDGVVTTPPTCTEKGVKTYTCKRDASHTKTEEIDPLGHTPGAPATCTEDQVCTVCGEVLTEKTGHKPVTHTEPASCTVKGYIITVCETCGEELSFETIPAFGHTAGAAVMEDKAEATCETDGSYNMVVYCATCNEKLSSTAYTIPATGHTWSAWVTITEADFENEGLKKRTCSVCSKEESEVIPKSKEFKDEESGISVRTDKEAYDGKEVEVKIEEVFDGSHYMGQSFGKIETWNIKTYVDGEQAQPETPVYVKIPIPADFNEDKVFVYHINSQTGEREKMDVEIIDGYACFWTTSFSIYIVVDESTKAEVETDVFVIRPYTIAAGVTDELVLVVPGTTAADLLAASNATDILDANGEKVAEDSKLLAGMQLVIMDGEEIKDSMSIIVIGDVNGDGEILANDARTTLRYSVGLDNLNDTQRKAADVSGDGAITAADARSILRASVELDDPKAWLGNF